MDFIAIREQGHFSQRILWNAILQFLRQIADALNVIKTDTYPDSFSNFWKIIIV